MHAIRQRFVAIMIMVSASLAVLRSPLLVPQRYPGRGGMQ